MSDLLVIKLPKTNEQITGLWCTGYPVHEGHNPDSLNYATLYSSERGIVPDQEVLKKEHNFFLKTLRTAGFKLHFLDFPKKLNQANDPHHDAMFIRDSGMFFGKYWIKANFSAKARQAEADVFAPLIAQKFNKEIIAPPKGAFLEFGEVAYFNTKHGDYYFGGLSRANTKGHKFIKEIIKPKHFYLLKTHGYHLDTVLSPVINKNNELVAIIVAKNMLTEKSLETIKKIKTKIIYINDTDSSGQDHNLGNYAVNTLPTPGVLIGNAKFTTPGVEEQLEELGIKHFVTPLTYFKFAGGSCHCLTNEIR